MTRRSVVDQSLMMFLGRPMNHIRMTGSDTIYREIGRILEYHVPLRQVMTDFDRPQGD